MKRKGELSRKKKINISGNKLKEYKDVFNLLDRNKKGMILTSDIIKIQSIFSFPIGKEEVKEMINEIDQNRKGKIDFKKFIDFMKMQIQYIDENDEDTVFSTYKEQFKNDFLGNKRKREKISSNNASRNEDESDLSIPDSTFRSEDTKDNIIIELEESLEDKSKINSNINLGKKVKSKKFANEDNISHNSNNSNYIIKNNKDDEDNKSEYYYYKEYRQNYILNNKKNMKENRKRGRPKLNKENFEETYTIQIFKHKLPKELITQIESKINNNFLENKKKNEQENNDSFYMKAKSKKSPMFNSKKNFERDNNQKSPISNKIDFNSQNEKITSYNINGISNKSPRFLALREENTNNKSSNKYIEGMKEKSITKKNINEENKKKNIKTGQLKKFMNENNYEANNNNKDNNINKYNNNNKITDGNNINNSISKEAKMKEDKINSNIKRYAKNQKTPHKNLKNVHIINNYEFEYKKNSKNEKVDKNALESSYSIIIEKSSLNMNELKKIFKQKKKNQNHLSKSATIDSEDKNRNLDNSFDIIIYNDDTEDNYNKKYDEIKKYYNKTYEKERNPKIRKKTRNKKDIKKPEYEYYKNKYKKKIKNGKSEDFELSNISRINSNCSFDNLSLPNTSQLKNTTVNGNNFTSTENNYYSSDRNFSNINSNDEDLNLSINWI